MFRAFTLAALVAYVSAQSLSSTCTSALSAIAFNPDAAACLSPAALIPIISGNSSTSIVPAIDNWLSGICGAAPCSNATLAAVVTNVTTGCSAELSSTGASSGLSSTITTLVQQYYPTVRQVLCLKDGSTNCITQTLTNIETVTGVLSLTNIVKLVANPPTTIPANLTCTNCVKAAYNIISSAIPQFTTDAAPALQSQCGASFTDGATPAGILQSATESSASSTTKSAALGSMKMLSQCIVTGLGVTSLIVASTIFTFLV